MRPGVHPALPRLRRDDATVQLGLETGAVVVGGLPSAVAGLVAGLDGRRTLGTLHREATQRGADPGCLDRVLAVLRSAGVLVHQDSRAGVHATADLVPSALRPDAAALDLAAAPPHRGQGAGLVAARRAAWVEVRGAGRVGAGVAVLLAASGVGRVTAEDRTPVQADDLAPGGAGPSDVGFPRDRAAMAAAGRAAPPVAESPRQRTGEAGAGGRTLPDLVVLAPHQGQDLDGAARLLAAGVPHLLARVSEAVGAVGPLVVPGRTSCLRCQELHRADRDPSWPELARQADRAMTASTAAVALAGVVSGLAAQHALSWLDGHLPASVDGTIEVGLADGLPRRRSWRPHPACGCGWGP